MPPDRGVDVLIVDDDRDIAESLQDALTDEGYTVAVARDGEDALAYLAAEPAPLLILLDWMMPRCDGATFRTRQLAEPALADIPVALVTADPRHEQKSEVLDVDAVLKKPIPLTDLLDLVIRFAGRQSG